MSWRIPVLVIKANSKVVSLCNSLAAASKPAVEANAFASATAVNFSASFSADNSCTVVSNAFSALYAAICLISLAAAINLAVEASASAAFLEMVCWRWFSSATNVAVLASAIAQSLEASETRIDMMYWRNGYRSISYDSARRRTSSPLRHRYSWLPVPTRCKVILMQTNMTIHAHIKPIRLTPRATSWNTMTTINARIITSGAIETISFPCDMTWDINNKPDASAAQITAPSSKYWPYDDL